MTERAPIESSPRLLWSKTGRALGLSVLFAAALQWMPGLEPLRWMPDDPMAFAPALFRSAPVEGEEDAPDEVDETRLVAIGPGMVEGPADEDDIPVGLRPIEALLIDDVEGPAGPGGEADDEADALDPEPDPGPALVWDPDAELPPQPKVRTTEAGLPLLPIEDPQGGMRRLYRALARAEDGEPGALTRVVHYGDSLITGDYVTQTVRRLMQKRFGDGGHGFVLAGRPSPWYRRDNLDLDTSEGWQVNRLTRPPIDDGAYGLGGVTVRTRKRGQWVRMRPDTPPEPEVEVEGAPVEHPVGARVSRMQVLYLGQPGGGRFQMQVGGPPVVIETETEAQTSRVAEVRVPDGHHTFELETLGGGEVRLFGVVFERDGPGVVYDSLGLDGARARLLERFDRDHWHDQLRLRRPDLLVLHYGTNESQFRRLSSKRYRQSLSETIGHLRAALPGVSCLLVGPMDRAEKHPETGKLVTRPVVKRIVRVQREVAWRQGCAFWNTYRAMGGEGSMARWYRMKPKLASGDLTHPTRRGADRIGQMLYLALMDGYARYTASLEPPPPQPMVARPIAEAPPPPAPMPPPPAPPTPHAMPIAPPPAGPGATAREVER